MKAIMISIQPQLVEKILNGEKTIEIRKTMPKCELPCKVYIYCNKPKKWYAFSNWGATSDEFVWKIKDKVKMCDRLEIWDDDCEKLNGKVVAEFTLKNIVKFDIESLIFMGKERELMQKSCLDGLSLRKYLGDKTGYSWGIDNLKVYETPKELSEFSHYIPNNKCPKKECGIDCEDCMSYDVEHETCLDLYYLHRQIKRPPQSYCYVEELEDE